jgi:MFS family permease
MLSGRFGALREGAFRSYFLGSTVSALGDAVAQIALAFAVIRYGSVTELGIILAGRQVASSIALMVGGVVGDRLPRARVLVAASVVQGLAQGGSAALVLSGSSLLAVLLPLQVVFGIADGVVQPLQTGLVPQVISTGRLQEANALLQTARSATWTVGPALGGVLVAVGSPGSALLLDAATFAVAAVWFAGLRLPPLESPATGRFLAEFREGFRAFVARDWVWMTAVGFGIGNVAHQAQFVLGPAISDRHYGGAGAWAATGTAFSAGMVVGGFGAMRARPSRPYVACIASATLIGVPMVAWGLLAPLWVLLVASIVAGVGVAYHVSLWYTVFQQEIPEELQSRVTSFENLGSFVLNPIGMALAAPVAVVIGTQATLVGGGVVTTGCDIVLLTLPSVWAIRRASSASREPS